ncbi:MAG: hypothetical protein LBB77_01465, partial [Treponema sp.]|nr:hypothetical protein [Treponema sp.]
MTPLPGKAGKQKRSPGAGYTGKDVSGEAAGTKARDGGAGQNRRTLVLLGALCLFLSTLEYLIPKPLPFIR